MGSIKNILTIIKTPNGNIFGGYDELGFGSNLQTVSDTNAFIFSLINKENKPFKAKRTYNSGGYKLGPIFGSAIRGPILGYNDKYDINITSLSNEYSSSSANFGYSFNHSDYKQGTERARTILAGSLNFKTLEIEVFWKLEKT